MQKLFFLKIPKTIDNCMIDELSHFVSSEKIKKIARYRVLKDALQSLVGEIIVRIQLSKQFRVKNRDIIFTHNPYGKPFVSHMKDFHFNLSHSGEIVVCAIDEYPLGVDVEKLIPIDLKIACRFFSKQEYEALMQKDIRERLPYFFTLWTLKESFIKAHGLGFSIPLDKFSIRMRGNNISVEGSRLSEGFFLKQYPFNRGYKLSICCIHNNFPTKLEELTLDGICQEANIHLSYFH